MTITQPIRHRPIRAVRMARLIVMAGRNDAGAALVAITVTRSFRRREVFTFGVTSGHGQ